MLNMTRSALGAADRLACGRGSLTGTRLAQQGTGFAQTLMRYTQGHWAGLTRFLDDGRIEVDSNTVERGMRVSANFDARCALGVGILRIRLRFQQARRFGQ